MTQEEMRQASHKMNVALTDKINDCKAGLMALLIKAMKDPQEVLSSVNETQAAFIVALASYGLAEITASNGTSKE